MNNKILLASKSLTGVSIGDAFGESFFGEESQMKTYIRQRILPDNSLDLQMIPLWQLLFSNLWKSLAKSIRIF